jgi:hypothetical protein
VRHKIARDPVVGVVQEDFQYFPDFLAPRNELRGSGCLVADRCILHLLLRLASAIVVAEGDGGSKLVTGLAPLFEQGIGGLA